ncbi:unnamed protein product, partial [Phaeothamnion confervicola]
MKSLRRRVSGSSLLSGLSRSEHGAHQSTAAAAPEGEKRPPSAPRPWPAAPVSQDADPDDDFWLGPQHAISEDQFALMMQSRAPVEVDIKEQCRRKLGDFATWKTVLSFFPIVKWVPKYIRSNLNGDIVAGLTVTVLTVPQAVSCSILAQLPAQYGLFSGIFPCLVYVLMGTSRHLHVGPFVITAMMSGTAVASLLGRSGPAVTGEADLEFAAVSAALCMMAGFLQVAFGFLRFGSLAVLLSDPVVSAVTCGAAFIVCVGQLTQALGIVVPKYEDPGSVFKIFFYHLSHLNEIKPCTALFFVFGVTFLLLIRDINLRYKARLKAPIPGELIAVVFAILTSYVFDLHNKYGMKIIGNVPEGMPTPAFPITENVGIMSLFSSAVTIAVVSYVITISICKTLAAQFDYSIDDNQELVALGSANIIGGFFRCFVSSGSLSRSAAMASTGGKTLVAAGLSVFGVIIVVLALTPMLAPLPLSTLAAIIFVALRNMIWQIFDCRKLWRLKRSDCVIWCMTFLSTLIFNVGIGVLLAVGINMLCDTYRSAHPDFSQMAWVPGTPVYRDINRYENLMSFEGICILRFNSQLSYLSKDIFFKLIYNIIENHHEEATVKTRRMSLAGHTLSNSTTSRARRSVKLPVNVPSESVPVRFLVLECAAINDIDSSALTLLTRLRTKLQARGVTLLLATPPGYVRDTLERGGYTTASGPHTNFVSLHAAVVHAL